MKLWKRFTLMRPSRMFRMVCCILLLVVSPSLAADPAPVEKAEFSLFDIYRLAIERSEIVKNAREDLFIAERLRDKALAVLMPDLAAFYDYTRYDEANAMQPEWSQTYGLRLGQSFTLNGSEIRAYRMAGGNIARTRFMSADIVERALFELTAAYYDVLRAIEGESIARANVARLEAYAAAVMQKLSLEEAPRTARYRAEAELARAEAALVQAQNAIHLARSRLGVLLELPEGYSLKTEQTAIEARQPDELARLKETAIENRSDLNALRLQIKIQEEQIEITRGAYWPNVSLQGVYRENEADPDAFAPAPNTLSGSVTLSMPIFEGGLRKAQVTEARAVKRKTELDFGMLSKLIRIEVEAAFRDLAAQAAIIESLDRQLVSANENYTAVELQFKNGLADSIDVMDANTLLQTSENELTEAKYGRVMAHIQLKRAVGVFLKEIMEKLEVSAPVAE